MDSSPDIIKDASDALKPIEDRGITVMQGWYDKDLNKCHVTLWDLGETDDNFSDDDAEGVTLSLQPCSRGHGCSNSNQRLVLKSAGSTGRSSVKQERI